MPFPKRIAGSSAVALFLLVTSMPGFAQEHAEGSTEHEFHRNHFGGLVGISTHHNTDESGATLGLDYARQFSPRWAVAAYLELVSSKLERDVIVAVGGAFYPTPRLAFVVAPGLESVEKDVEEHGEVVTESEVELMIRLGVAYGFRLTPQASLGPALFLDRGGDRWTSLIGVAMVVGF